MYLYGGWLALIDVNVNATLILAVIKFVFLFDRAAVPGGYRGIR